ncbi:hypothetical protein [Microvirga sp. BSC39]|uniref:hypothetical protein n=1 Tax=Microvirga sp. BSC39 TaxID=1549810 RepID=UPI0004E95E2A|nr:hypothetical protein [Microvirga sp. BSC39]KFG68623.1 hypothetical protein JH26_15835 [Microvirga sp. BSC39]
MSQGSNTERELNYQHFPFRASGIDPLCLTYAHIDHSGVVPKLLKAGFDGPIYATGGMAGPALGLRLYPGDGDRPIGPAQQPPWAGHGVSDLHRGGRHACLRQFLAVA